MSRREVKREGIKSWRYLAVLVLVFLLLSGCMPSIPSIPTPPTQIPIPSPTIPGMEKPTTVPITAPLTDLSGYGKKSFNQINYERLQERTIWSAGYYESEMVDFYTKSGFRGMLWEASPGSPERVDFVAGRAKGLKAIGWFYGAGFALFGPDTEESIAYVEKNYLQEEDILIDLDGNKVKRPFFWAEQKLFPYFYSLFSDNYIRYLKDMLKNLIDHEVYGITFDDSLYMGVTGGPVPSAPGNSNIIEAFKTHLKDEYDSGYLKTRFGVANVDSFDFKGYFKANAKEMWNPDPLMSEYLLFLHEKTASVLKELKDYANQEAGKKGKRFIISGNSPVLHPYWFRFYDIFDHYIGEFFLYAGDPQRASIVSKVIESLGDKQFIYYTQIETAGLSIPEKVNASAKEQLADIYSHPNGAYIGSYANRIKIVKDGIFLGTPPTFDWEITGDFSRFMEQNEFIFNELKSYADVGVLYSLPSMLGGHGWNVHVEGKTNQVDKSLWGTLMLLQDSGVQFKVLFTGDDRVYPRKTKLELAELKQYRTIMLPQVFSISDENVDTILKYVEDGGTVIAINSFATHDEKGAVTQRSKISSLVSEGEHSYGKGKFVFFSEDYGEKYYNAARDSNKFFGSKDTVDSFSSKVSKYISKVLQTSLPHGVAALAYSAPDGDVLFLVNYNLDPEKQVFSEVTSATVSLEKENTQVYFFDPNRESPLLLKNGDPVSFEYLGILFYTPKEWAKARWEQIKGEVGKVSSDKAGEALKLAEQDNYLGAYLIGNEVIKLPKKKVLYDEAHNSAYSLTWEGAAQREPKDPFARAMRTYRGFLEERFELQIKTTGQLSLEELSVYDLVIIDTPENLSSSEIGALQQYIGNGGRVLLFGGFGASTQSVNDFLASYGMGYERAGYIKKTENYIGWYSKFLANDFKLFDLDSVYISDSKALRVNPPSIAIGFTDAEVYIDKNNNNARDPDEERGPFALLGAYKNKDSGGMLLVYSDHSQQDWIIDVANGGATLGLHLALLDLAING